MNNWILALLLICIIAMAIAGFCIPRQELYTLEDLGVLTTTTDNQEIGGR